MYPTPRIVLIRSMPFNWWPNFLRRLLTCMSMLRSNGDNSRPKTSFTRSSRLTIWPALRSSISSRSYSTPVSSTSSPPRRTLRVLLSISTSPILIVSRDVVAACGQHQDGNTRTCANASEYVEAVGPGKHDVKDHQIVLVRKRAIDASFAVMNRFDGVTFRLQILSDQLAKSDVVVNYKYPFHWLLCQIERHIN